jgi:hypothetical protein
VAPDLAARRLEDGLGWDQGHLVELNLVFFGHGPPDGSSHHGQVIDVTLHFLDDDHPLFTVDLHGEGGAATRPQGRVAALGRDLQVLWVEIAATDDDQVLEPAGDEQVVGPKEAQIAGAQEGPLARRQMSLEISLRGVGPSPVAVGHMGTGHPDLPHRTCSAGLAGLGVNHQHALVHPGVATAHQRADRGARGARLGHGIALQGCGVHLEHDRRRAPDPAAHEEGGLRQAVAGIKDLAAEAAGAEHDDKPLQGVGPHGLGAVEGHVPRRQVEPGPLLLGDLAGAELVGEVGAAAGRSAIARDGLKPPQRPLKEGHGRHEDATGTEVERLEHAAHEPHVMVERQPAHDDRRLGLAEGAADHLLVVDEVAVADHDAFGGRSGARGVLEAGDVLAGNTRVLPFGLEAGGEVVGGEAADLAEARELVAEGLHPRQHGRGGQGQGGPGVANDREEARQAAGGARRVGRYRDEAAVKTAQKAGNEVEAGGIEQQGAVPGRGVPVEVSADGTSAGVQLTEGQLGSLGFAILQKHVSG